jgi:hypothetical protein
MAPADSRRPAIADIAQLIQRVDDPREAIEPIALMERAIREAAEDAGAPKIAVVAIREHQIPRTGGTTANRRSPLRETLGGRDCDNADPPDPEARREAVRARWP